MGVLVPSLIFVISDEYQGGKYSKGSGGISRITHITHVSLGSSLLFYSPLSPRDWAKALAVFRAVPNDLQQWPVIARTAAPSSPVTVVSTILDSHADRCPSTLLFPRATGLTSLQATLFVSELPTN
jgi:hypothetical protein